MPAAYARRRLGVAVKLSSVLSVAFIPILIGLTYIFRNSSNTAAGVLIWFWFAIGCASWLCVEIIAFIFILDVFRGETKSAAGKILWVSLLGFCPIIGIIAYWFFNYSGRP